MSQSNETSSRLYRESALKHLQSSESTESLMRVVGPSGWVLAIGVALVFAGAIYWSIFGTVTTFVQGQGLLGPAFGEARDFTVTHSGVVQSFSVRIGETVKAGDRLASIEIASVAHDKLDAERTLRALRSEQELLTTYWNTLLPQQLADLEQNERDLQRQIEWDERRVQSREEIVQGFEKASKEGLITPLRLEQARDDLIQASASLDEAKFNKEQLVSRRLQIENQKDTALQAMNDRIMNAEENLSDIENTLESGGKVISDMNGRVVEIAAAVGSFVQPGATIVTIRPVNEDIEGVFFADPLHGKKIIKGMEVNVAPSTVEPARYGTIRGKVVWVSEDPQSNAAIERQLGNPDLARSLAGSRPPISFGVQLEKDTDAPSGLKWSSGHGPDLKVRSGTLADAEVAVEQTPPIVLIIPAIRKLLGINR